MKKTICFLMFTIIVISGCAKTIDGSSQENFDKSLAAIGEDLTKEQKQELGMAVAKIGFNIMKNSKGSKEEFKAEIRTRLDGMTRNQILSFAEELNESR